MAHRHRARSLSQMTPAPAWARAIAGQHDGATWAHTCDCGAVRVESVPVDPEARTMRTRWMTAAALGSALHRAAVTGDAGVCEWPARKLPRRSRRTPRQ